MEVTDRYQFSRFGINADHLAGRNHLSQPDGDGAIAREKEEEAARQAALEAEQKAKRDARYAARKGKGKKK